MCHPWEISNRMQCVSCFFIKMENVLANLEGSNFKNFPGTSAPTMVGPP